MLNGSNCLGGLRQRPLVTVDAAATVLQALAIARVSAVHHLPVVRGWRLVGLVCNCDLQGATADTPVDAVMSRPAVTLEIGASALDAARAMQERDVGSVILTDRGQLAGIVTRGDLLLCNPEVHVELARRPCAYNQGEQQCPPYRH